MHHIERQVKREDDTGEVRKLSWSQGSVWQVQSAARWTVASKHANKQDQRQKKAYHGMCAITFMHESMDQLALLLLCWSLLASLD